jgi:hypothetical protein
VFQNIKGSLRASFFIGFCFCLQLDLVFGSPSTSDNKQWQALTHSIDGYKGIRGSSFSLIPDSSSKNNSEFEASKEVLLSTPKGSPVTCLFPARQLWLSKKFKTPEADLSHCDGLHEFLRKVPSDQVALVFSSENLASPSSMMGHILIKLSGRDAQSQYREYAISFYTDITGITVPKLMFVSLVTGKKGIFSLGTYSEKLNLYLNDEGRNVWEYDLQLTKDEKHLLMLHLWELKQASLDYFFHTYNCATVTNFILAVAKPELLPKEIHNITPIDVVKRINASEVVESARVLSSEHWEARMLSEAASPNLKNIARRFISDGKVEKLQEVKNEKQKFIIIELTTKYLSILKKSGKIAELEYQDRMLGLEYATKRLKNNYSIDIADFKIPTKTPPDSQWSMGVVREEGKLFSEFSYLPTSHDLNDDNRQYFSENELRLGAFSILANKNEVIIDKLTLYKAQSIIPHDPILGGVSGRFHLGLLRSYDKGLELRHSFEVSVAVGKAIEPHKAITLYGLMGTGVGYGKDKGYLYLNPSLGVIIRERNNYKTILNMEYKWNEFNEHTGITTIELTQAKYLTGDWGLFFGYKMARGNGEKDDRLSFKVKRYF